MDTVQELEVWSRTIAAMHGTDKGWMTVAMPVHWGPIEVTLPQERLVLPLTQKYFVKGFMLSSGTNPGHQRVVAAAGGLRSELCQRLRLRLDLSPAVPAAGESRRGALQQPDVHAGAERRVGRAAGRFDRRHRETVI